MQIMWILWFSWKASELFHYLSIKKRNNKGEESINTDWKTRIDAWMNYWINRLGELELVNKQ